MIASKSKSPFRVVIFDFDGTLADTHRLRLESWLKVLTSFGAAVSTSELENHILRGTTDESIAETFISDADSRMLKQVLVQRSLLRSAYSSRIRLFPDVRPVLRCLQEQGYRLAICSGTPKRIMLETLTRTRTRELFEDVCSTNKTRFRKPDPRILLKLLKEMGADARLTLFVGDTVADELMAQDAGCGFVAIARRRRRPAFSTFQIIRSLRELLKLLKE